MSCGRIDVAADLGADLVGPVLASALSRAAAACWRAVFSASALRRASSLAALLVELLLLHRRPARAAAASRDRRFGGAFASGLGLGFGLAAAPSRRSRASSPRARAPAWAASTLAAAAAWRLDHGRGGGGGGGFPQLDLTVVGGRLWKRTPRNSTASSTDVHERGEQRTARPIAGRGGPLKYASVVGSHWQPRSLLELHLQADLLARPACAARPSPGARPRSARSCRRRRAPRGRSFLPRALLMHLGELGARDGALVDDRGRCRRACAPPGPGRPGRRPRAARRAARSPCPRSAGRSPPGVMSGAVTMKMTSSTSITSMYGTTLISCIGAALAAQRGACRLPHAPAGAGCSRTPP